MLHNAYRRHDFLKMAQPPPNTLIQTVQDDITDVQKLLVLKAMTQYVPKDYHKAATTEPPTKLSNDEHKTWRTYLDKLCYLCDFESGGKTVTALLVQAAAERSVLWLATNCSKHHTRVRMAGHLSFILMQLLHLHATVDDLAEVVCRQSIDLSEDKVEDYRGKLEREVKRIEAERSTTATSTEQALLRCLNDVTKGARGDSYRLCTAAQDVVLGHHYRTLMTISSQHESRYRNVKHWLHRLCSWYGASRYVAKHSRRFTKQIGNAQVELLPMDQLHGCQIISGINNEFSSTLIWILGKQRQQFLTGLQGHLAFATAFLKKYGGKSHGTIMHAEAALAQFAYVRKMEFVFGDRYIGCSKPSCYACSMYLSEHPGDFVQRPSHGNAWFKWSPPRLIDQLEDRMTSNIMRKMVAIMQADLNATLLSNDLGKRQPFESTSGIGTTIRRRHEVLLQTQQG